MVDDIVEMILKEARSREEKDLILNILYVCDDIDDKIGQILQDLQDQQDIKDFSYSPHP